MGTSSDKTANPPGEPRIVQHEYTLNWAPILRGLRASLLVSTYQAGKVVVVSDGFSADGFDLRLSYHNFEQAMGIAVAPGPPGGGGAVGGLAPAGGARIAPRLEPPGRHDACFLARVALYTGVVQGHELAWSGDDLWMVNTLFSCLCTLDDRHSFVPALAPAVSSPVTSPKTGATSTGWPWTGAPALRHGLRHDRHVGGLAPASPPAGV